MHSAAGSRSFFLPSCHDVFYRTLSSVQCNAIFFGRPALRLHYRFCNLFVRLLRSLHGSVMPCCCCGRSRCYRRCIDPPRRRYADRQAKAAAVLHQQRRATGKFRLTHMVAKSTSINHNQAVSEQSSTKHALGGRSVPVEITDARRVIDRDRFCHGRSSGHSHRVKLGNSQKRSSGRSCCELKNSQ